MGLVVVSSKDICEKNSWLEKKRESFDDSSNAVSFFAFLLSDLKKWCCVY